MDDTTSQPLDPTTPTIELFYRSKETLEPLLPVNIILGVQALTLNTFVLHHYYSHRGTFVPSMYLMIGVADSTATVLLLLQCLLLKLIQEDDQDELPDFPSFSSWLLPLTVAGTGISWRLSILSNVILSVARTIKIRRPFQRIRRRVAMFSILVYGVFWTALACHDVTVVGGKNWNTVDVYMTYPWIGAELGNILAESIAAAKGCEVEQDCYLEIAAKIYLLTLLVLAYILPVLIVLVCMVVQILWITRPHDELGIAGAVPNNQRHVTVTILQITALFFVCNSAATSWYLVTNLVYYAQNEELAATVPKNMVLQGIAYTTMPLANAAFSPLIIICRSSDLKQNLISRCSALRHLNNSRKVQPREHSNPTVLGSQL